MQKILEGGKERKVGFEMIIIKKTKYRIQETARERDLVIVKFVLGFIRPFPSSLEPLFQSASKCETIPMKMTLICMKMKLHAELIFI